MLPFLPGDIIKKYDKEEIAEFPDNWYSFNFKENYIATTLIARTLLINSCICRGDRAHAKDLVEEDKTGRARPVSAHLVLELTPGRLSLTNLSLNLKHKLAWERGSARPNCNYIIVFEDDVLLQENSVDLINLMIENDLFGYDYIDIAGGAGLSGWDVYTQTNRYVHHITRFSTRTTCAYIMRKSVALQLISAKTPILFPIDFQLTYMFSLIRPKVGWLDPPAFQHGSVIGTYEVSNER